VTALALVMALGANMGLFGLTRHDDGPGQFKLVDNTQQSPSPSVRTEIVDAPVPAPASAARSRGEPSHPEFEPRESDGEDD